MRVRSVISGFACLAALAACSETSDAPPPDATVMRTGSASDEKACLNAVAAQTSNTVMVLSSEFSQANTLVMVGVGPERSPWRCLVSGGVVAEVSFAGSEGRL